MRVAVTGATGVIGKYFVEACTGAPHSPPGLLQNGAELELPQQLVVLGRSLEKMEAAFGQRHEKSQLVQTDYSSEHLAQALEGVDAVVHLAARRPDARFDSFDDFYCNISSTENLLKACATNGIMNVIFASTGSIYSPAFNHAPFAESQAVSPNSFYAISKLACEGLAASYGIKMKSVRLAQIVAVGERPQYMFAVFLRKALAGERLSVFGRGRGSRDYIYARDAAEAMLAALRYPVAAGVFNLGAGHSVTHLDLASTMSSVFELSPPALDESKPEDASTLLMDSSAFYNAFSWRPRYTLTQALCEIREVLTAATP